jgi:hypothetical protein
VLFYGAVSAQTEKVVEFFLEREAAEAMIGEVREDEPELAVDLRVETIELGQSKARALALGDVMNLEDLRPGDSSRPNLTVSGRSRDLGPRA